MMSPTLSMETTRHSHVDSLCVASTHGFLLSDASSFDVLMLSYSSRELTRLNSCHVLCVAIVKCLSIYFGFECVCAN